MLSLHESLIRVQQRKLQDLAQAIGQSQRTLRCQQRLVESARASAVSPESRR